MNNLSFFYLFSIIVSLATICSTTVIGQIMMDEFIILGDTFNIEVKKEIDGTFVILIENETSSKSQQFSVKPLLLKSFENGFIKALPSILDQNQLKTLEDGRQKAAKPVADKLFFAIAAASLEPDPFEPDAGCLTILDSIPILQVPDNSKKVKKYLGKILCESFSKKELKKNLIEKKKALEEALKNRGAVEEKYSKTINDAKKEYIEAFENFITCKKRKERAFEKDLALFTEDANRKKEMADSLKSKIQNELNEKDEQIKATTADISKNKKKKESLETEIRELKDQKATNILNLIELTNSSMDDRNNTTYIKNAQEKLQNKLIDVKKQYIKESGIRDSIRADTTHLDSSTRSLIHLQLNKIDSIILLLNNEILEIQTQISGLDIELQEISTLENDIEMIKRETNKIDNEIESKSSEIKDILKLQDSLEQKLEIDQQGRNDISKDYDQKKKEADIAKKNQREKTLIVDYVQIEFNDGFIENILVIGRIIGGDSERLKFENAYPIGFSTKKNFDRLDYVSLYEKKNGNVYRMKLGKLITMYEQNHRILTKDFSPKNQVVKLIPPNNHLCLKKEATNKLFEAQVFTDLIGFNEVDPNGLVQTQVSRKIPIRTRRFAFPGDVREISFGYLAYVEPFMAFSKFENKERYLVTQSKSEIINNALFSQKYVSTIELKEYENFSTGMDINFILLDFANFKSTLYLDFGFRYGRTSIQDSLIFLTNGEISTSEQEPDTYNVNTYQLYPKFIWKILPDERYGFTLSYQWNLFNLRNNRLRQVENKDEFLLGKKQDWTYWFSSFELGGFYKPNKDSDNKLFFRYRFHHQYKQWNTNYDQAQIGYSFFINTRRK